ncbi:hypothetical protein COLO4_37181 [Corchorus olitorius]|uniref:Uncharacterized protein n=1 Tax=Corchorus olitorius TaxID=93759 RepID=A0A1R3G355_9ROSI|nr:hypothetical protein COLO4_37181 [Corchorus olitorius]
MGLHLLALAKLRLLSSSPTFTPLLAATLICPFLLKLSFSLGIVRRTYTDVIESTRLFFFQLRQIIAFEDDHDQPPPGGNGGGVPDRWQRALRLICQRITLVRRSPAVESDEDNFHTLTMLSL